MIKYLLLALFFVFPYSASALTYYTDFSGSGGNGLSTSTSFNSIDAFTEVARAPGDILIVRRNQATTTQITSLGWTSSGLLGRPIVVSADYNNLWNDFSTSSQTYTVSAGTTTLMSSASTTGIVAGDWVYVAGDCVENQGSVTYSTCTYYNHVATVTPTYIQLSMPYAGYQSGSGISLRVIGKNPLWFGTTSSVDTSGAYHISYRGIDHKTEGGGFVYYLGSFTAQTHVVSFANSVITQVSKSQIASTPSSVFYADGSRAEDILVENSIIAFSTSTYAHIFQSDVSSLVVPKLFNFKNVVFDCGTTSAQVRSFYGNDATADNSFLEFNGRNIYTSGCPQLFYLTLPKALEPSAASLNTVVATCINCQWKPLQERSATSGISYFYEQNTSSSSLTATTSAVRTSMGNLVQTRAAANLRSGGGQSSLIFTGSSSLTPSTSSPMYSFKLFEYSFWAGVGSKLYSVYVNALNGTYTGNPVPESLWIECEYLASQSPTTTYATKRSTTTVNFTGLPTSWQALSVACGNVAEGTLWLRGYYARPNSTGAEVLTVDATPLIQ